MNLLFLALLLGAAGPAPGGPPAPLSPAALVIDNQGRQSIYNLYATETGRRWGQDRLDDATIPAGRSRSLALAHRATRCQLRVKLVLADRSTRIRKIDVCRGGRWIVSDSGERFEPATRPKPAG